MKHPLLSIRYLITSVMLVLLPYLISAQCVPMGPDECPDPENNGQICPDILPVGYLNEFFSEEATILVPEEYLPGVFLHHLTIIDIANLPTGLNWVSNAENNELMAGNYYCIVLDGTPEIADTFLLKIVIDVYLNLNGNPVFFDRITDSTSLSMIIMEEHGLEDPLGNIVISSNYPNPFSDRINIRFEAKLHTEAQFEVYSLLGEKVHSEKINIHHGENNHVFEGNFLPQGTYAYVISFRNTSVSGIIFHKE